MIVAARCHHGHRAVVLGAIRILVDALVQLRRSTQRERPKKCRENEHSDTRTRGPAAFHCREFLTACQNPQDYFFENPGGGSALLSDLFPHR